MTATDFAVIGGGIVGLALSREIKSRFPSSSVVVLEKESDVGLHASGRNSGVLHAGFYYAPDSLKAQLTRRGNAMLRDFAAAERVPVRACGKVVVATSEQQLPALEELARRGEANGVDLEVIDESRLADLEPRARTVHRAIWSPTTAVADPRGMIDAMRRAVVRAGVEVRTGARAMSGGPGYLVVNGERLEVGHVVNAAGLYADQVGRWFGFCDDYVMMPFKGLYWYGSWPQGRLRRHVYPVPDPRNPFLGVHFTVTVDGRAKIGPTAIPVFWREGYRRLDNFKGAELREIMGNYPRFLRSEHHDSPGLITAEIAKYSRRHLVKQARNLVPDARATDFTTRGRPGIRAQLLNVSSGRLEMDFVVRGDENSTHVLNAVSPAWTSALPFAQHVVDKMPV